VSLKTGIPVFAEAIDRWVVTGVEQELRHCRREIAHARASLNRLPPGAERERVRRMVKSAEESARELGEVLLLDGTMTRQ
jgi:hypothetical protein